MVKVAESSEEIKFVFDIICASIVESSIAAMHSLYCNA